MNTKLLQNLGLTEREAEIYLILLDLGSTTTGQVIKKSGLHKATVYSILQRLIDQGLVSYVIKDGIRYFEAADPDTFLNVLREREENLLEILPELKKKKELAKQKQEAYVLEGLKGVKAARDRSLKLNKGEEILVLGASQASNQALESYWENYHKRRVKAGIKARMLWSETIKKIGKNREKLSLTELKYLPKELETPADIDIFKDTVDIRVFTDKPFVFHMENKMLADAFRNYFNLLWNQDVKVYKSFEAVTDKFWSMLDELKHGDEYFVLGASHGFGGKKLKEWFMNYHRERVKRKIKANLLCVYEDYNSILPQLIETGDSKMEYGELKRLPPEFSSPMQINLYKGNKVLMFLWGKEEMICFEIESDVLYKNFKAYFDGLWDTETQTLRGFDAAWENLQSAAKSGDLKLIGARGYYFDKYPEHLKVFQKLVDDYGTKIKNIVDFDAKGHPLLSIKGMEVRYVPNEFVNPSVIFIYNNKVSISQWTEAEPIVLHINNKNVYESYMKQFDLLWNQETQTLRGFDTVWEYLQELASSGEEVYFIGARGYYFDNHPHNLKVFEEMLIKNKTKIKNIVDFGAKGKPFLKIKNQEVRYVSNEFLNPNVVWIYKNKVAITQYAENKIEPILMIISNNNVYDAHKKQFDLLWKAAKP